jgi:CHAT domain-containing protein
MGPVPSDDGHDLYFSDMYVCSYTPTLDALIQSRRFCLPKPDPQHSLLLVAQPDDSLPGVFREIRVVQRVQSQAFPVTTLVSAMATPETVIEGLHSHTLVHFACHGIQEAGNPLSAAFKLHGGSYLNLRDITNSRLHHAEFAFLSACHSAEPTDMDDETGDLSIAAAMQYHGFGSVVGAMWEMVDEDGPVLSRRFYKRLLSGNRRGHDAPLGERSAEALRFAVRKLRKKRGMTLERWVYWVHYGA